MRIVLLGCTLAFASAEALADGCDGLRNKVSAAAAAKKGSAKEGGFFSKLAVIFNQADATPDKVDCASVVVAVQSLVNPSRTGGRSLEPDQGLDRAAAQAELDAALTKPEVKDAIDAVHAKYADEEIRLLMEAAVFDQNGAYAARDLRLAQLREKVGA